MSSNNTTTPTNTNKKRSKQQAFDGPTLDLSKKQKRAASGGNKGKKRQLSDEQQRAVDFAIAGKNIFITGPGGTGKSFLIERLVNELSVHRGRIVDVVATTGIAAIKVKGQTLHSWAGVGLAEKSAEQLCSDLKRQPWLAKAKKRWLKVATLIVDEVSMLDRVFFEKLDHIGRRLRQDNERPFGGIQLIFCGDFFQLPPVVKRNKPSAVVGSSNNPENVATTPPPVEDVRKYCFESTLWSSTFPHENVVQLRHLFRQHGDTTFQQMLNEIRYGQPLPNTIENLMKCVNRPREQRLVDLGIEPTRLYPLNEQVDQLNRTCLVKLQTEEQFYQSFVLHHGSFLDRNVEFRQKTEEKLKSGCIAGDMVSLKIGAQVMLLKNRPLLGLVNGSRGIVVDFKTMDLLEDQDDIDVDPDDEGDNEGDDELDLDLRKTKEMLKSKANVNAYKEQQRGKRFPVVRFLNGVEMTVGFQHWSIHSAESDDAQDHWEMYYFQVPLKLAWACSIHKAQGMELDCASIKMCGMFEEGQAYVAFSRIHDLNSLYLEDFDVSTIRTNQTVVEYYKQLDKQT